MNFVTEMLKRHKDQGIELRLLADELAGEYGNTVLSDLLGGIDLTKLSVVECFETVCGVT